MIATLMQWKSLKNNKEGFTLLEVIIAMSIMAIAFAAILAVEGGAINASARAKLVNQMVLLARNQMVETEFEIEGKRFEEIEKEKSGNFEKPNETVRWKRTVKELKFPKLTGGGGGKKSEGAQDKDAESGGNSEMANMITKLITNFLSKALREVTVTVYWKRGKGEQSYSLTTYWVDLNHEFNFSE